MFLLLLLLRVLETPQLHSTLPHTAKQTKPTIKITMSTIPSIEDLPDYEDPDEIREAPPPKVPSPPEDEAEIRKLLSDGPLDLDTIAERLGPFHHNNSVIIDRIADVILDDGG
jgi:hypothetical protein